MFEWVDTKALENQPRVERSGTQCVIFPVSAKSTHWAIRWFSFFHKNLWAPGKPNQKQDTECCLVEYRNRLESLAQNHHTLRLVATLSQEFSILANCKFQVLYKDRCQVMMVPNPS